MPIRPEEDVEQAAARLEALLDGSLTDWRERETWRRRQVMDGRSGALDMPGSSWRDRPAVDRGDGVFLAGDMVAAPGLLAEVAWASGVEAGRLALGALATPRRSCVGSPEQPLSALRRASAAALPGGRLGPAVDEPGRRDRQVVARTSTWRACGSQSYGRSS